MDFLRGLRCVFVFQMYIGLILSEICSFGVDGDPKSQQSVGWIRVLKRIKIKFFLLDLSQYLGPDSGKFHCFI